MIEMKSKTSYSLKNENDLESKLILPLRPPKKSSCAKLCCNKINTTETRNIFLNEDNETNYRNTIRNQKYNIFTFIPLVLFNQFKLFSNQFYLLLAATQFISVLKVGFLVSYLGPLIFVLLITLVKEAFDDYKRYVRDREANDQKHSKITKNGPTEILSADIQIGDILEINQNERIPADMIILKSYSDESGSLFIRTDQLDGETDWKLRKACPLTQRVQLTDELLNFKGFISIEPPSRDIYSFLGVMNILTESSMNKEPLGLENTMWANTVLASKKAIGIVIYTGKETRFQMNSSSPRSKLGLLDLELNQLTKVLFFLMIISSIIIVLIKGFTHQVLQNFITFFRFVVLLCSILPISLRVNLDLAKIYHAYIITKDEHIPETIVRNSQIPEELGRIKYVFTDKTGTLTKNEMIFKKLALESDLFTSDNIGELKLIIEDECKVSDAPLLDMIRRSEFNGKRVRRNRNKIIRDLITAMSICHNVTPTTDDNGKVAYQASSPDEVALVKTAAELGLNLTFRNDKEIRITNPNNTEEIYEILAIFPFTSENKRMGIIVKNRTYKHIIFYLKGAENIMEKFVREEQKFNIKENADNLASVGLRTLVLTQKILTDEFFDKWFEEYKSAQLEMENRNEKVRNVINKLEGNMDFLGVTGVEDLLQDDVSDTIDALRSAGMKIWMLTGDKIETATCISISTGIKSANQRFFVIREQSDPVILKEKLMEFSMLDSNILIIDGESLDGCLTHLEKEFFQVCLMAPSVICCRCSPTQKACIVKSAKKYTNKRLCAVGDGGNDVSMIQESDVGIGIVGKEGMQASLASDFSITKFKHLRVLILWFGRLCYKNTSTISKFVIHRGLIISFIQFIFSIVFYCAAISIYNGVLIIGYSTFYTSLPIMSLLLDRDADFQNVIDFPPLYLELQKGRELSIKSFLFCVDKSIFQASVIMIGSLLLFDSLFLKIVTITFTALIFAELLNIYTEINRFNKYMIITLLLSLTFYILTLVFFRTVIDLYFIFQWHIILKILLLTFISWFPFFIGSVIRSKAFPMAHEKLNK